MTSTGYDPTAADNMDFSLVLGSVFSLSTGLVLLGFGLAYVRDLATLRAVPDAIWDTFCGRPVEGGLALPLLLTFGTLFVLVAGGLWGYRKLRPTPFAQPEMND